METQVKPFPEREERVADLRDYYRVIWRHRWVVVAVFVVVTLLAGVWTFLQTPVYRATATIEAQTQARRAMAGPDVSGMGASGFGWAAEERFYSTQIEIVQSRDLADRVIKRLGLKGDPLFKDVADPATALSRMVMASLRKDTGIIEISMTDPDPRRAAELANAYAQEFVSRNLELGRRGISQMVDEMQKQLDPIRQRIEEAEKDRFGIARNQDLYVPENQKVILEDNLKRYNQELTGVQIKMSELAGVILGLNALERNQGDPLSIQKISENEAVRDLVAQRTTIEKEIEGLKVRFRPSAPEFKEKQSQLDRIQGRLDEQVRTLRRSFEGEYELLKGQAASLSGDIDRTKRDLFEMGQRTSPYDIAKADVETRRKVYDSLAQSVNQVSLQVSLLNNNLQLLDKAMVPTAPIKPRTRLNLAMGMILGLMLGLGVVFFIDYIDNTIKSMEDVEQILRLHLLSIIPRYRETMGHAVREAYQTLRTSVLFSSRARQHKVLLVTSAGPREGKTSTIVNLAKTIASAGEKVLLIDCDLRRPKIHEDLGLEREHGLTNFLAGMGSGDYHDYVKPTSSPSLFALTCGPIPPNPPELFGTQRFRDLLADVKRDFDWVLVDSPPVVSLTDTIILASMADMVAFVVKHNENDRDMIRRCVANVRNVNPNVIGAILNYVDIGRSGDYYYAGYYYYTADGEKHRKKTRRRKEPPEKVGATG